MKITEMRDLEEVVSWHWHEEQVEEMIRKSKHVRKLRDTLKKNRR